MFVKVVKGNMGTNKSFKERFQSLVDAFSERLPSELYEMALLLEQLDKNGQTGQCLGDLRKRVHKLKGSSATFGFTSISQQAKNLEALIDEVMESSMAIDLEKKNAIYESFYKLQNLSEEPELDADPEELEEIPAETIPTEQWPRSEKRIFVPTDDEYLPHDLSDQLGFFGFICTRFQNLEEISTLIARGEQVLMIAHTQFLRDCPKERKEIAELKEIESQRLKIIYLSTDDDFNTRLLAVQSGGDAFFSYPVDIGNIVDKIEGFTQTNQDSPYHILIVDDDPEQVSFFALQLQQAGMITSVAVNPRQVIQILDESKPDLILMDMYMPECSGIELASIIRQHQAYMSIPIVFLSAETDREKQLKAISFGADGFLTKPIKTEHLITSVLTRAERTRSLRFFMERDSLTGLLNHTKLKERLVEEVNRADRVGIQISFAMLDIDFFKSVNDTYGHLTGDRVLKGLSRLLAERLRKTDIIGRYGGEEFGIILLNADPKEAKGIMDEIRENFSRIKQYSEGKEFYVTFSCGIAGYPDYTVPAELNEAADKALYRAKESGRNKAVIADHGAGKDSPSS
ncbi:MAG: diguanylate cyclase [Spirochaetales bacterium]|nr:diguanylate cyclase [Spirochaetales bacterium]